MYRDYTMKKFDVTKEAYDDLKALKLKEESFSDAIKRLAKVKGTLHDCYELWKDVTTKEKETIEHAIASGRRTTGELLKKLYG